VAKPEVLYAVRTRNERTTQMAIGIEGKVAVVTGGATGIGRVTALAFAREGARVTIVTAHNLTAAAHVVQEIEDLGGEASYVQCDVSNEAQVEAMVGSVVARFGVIDFAFNNAGVGPDGVTIPISPLLDLAETDWDTVVDTNLKGVFLCMKHELRQMRKQCSGVIVNTSSTAGLRMMPGFAAYGPSKAAIVSLTKVAALENKDKGIRINVVAPGPTRGTAMMERMLGCMEEGEGPPRELMGTPEDVARVVLWLCSDEASFVTGNVISVDGGLDIS
jgi:NAD(P)-dependent dehydrogenase (short-subunit alcohol dehydrogenase family)